MICPYIKKSETHIQCWSQMPDENEVITKGITSDHWENQMMECQKENCGAWYNGRCCYNGSSPENN